MFIYPAIDLYEGRAVRLYKGDYAQMTVYHNDPCAVAADFAAAGATHIHLVDLEGARLGTTPNLASVRAIVEKTGLFAEVGGGIRSMETIDAYLSVGVSRVILGTAAVTDEAFLRAAVEKYGEAVAVGVDIKDGRVAIKGWTETSALDAMDFCKRLDAMGVRTVICTDIFKDGAMMGTNRALYRTLSEQVGLNIIASGGVSSLEDVAALSALSIHGAIIGKAYYTGAIRLAEAIALAEKA